MSAIRTAIVDGHLLFAEGIIKLLEPLQEYDLKLDHVFTSAKELKRHLRIEDLDLIIMEIALPDEDGLQLIPELRKFGKSMKIMVLSSYSDSKFVKKALQTGADGYISKSNSSEELLDGIKQVINDRTFIAEGLHITPPAASSDHSNQQNGTNGSSYRDRFLIQKRLTRREQEILNLITQAKNNKEIATELYISDQTVGVHRKNIMRKLGVRNTVNLIKFAIEYQLV